MIFPPPDLVKTPYAMVCQLRVDQPPCNHPANDEEIEMIAHMHSALEWGKVYGYDVPWDDEQRRTYDQSYEEAEAMKEGKPRPLVRVRCHRANEELVAASVYCPACKESHTFNLKDNGGDVWTFNGDFRFPTFRNSMLVTSGCKTKRHKKGDDCWCNYEERYGEPSPFQCGVCHSYVTDGKIEYLPDCTHSMAGQKVWLPYYLNDNGDTHVDREEYLSDGPE